MTAWTPSHLRIELLSDTTFSRGEGTAGVVDVEVEHDDFGIPFVGGRTIRGLLRDSWLSMCGCFPELADAAEHVLGRSQSFDESCKLRVGDGLVSKPIREAVQAASMRDSHPLSSNSVLEGFTAVRFQTAEDRATGAPETATLRSSRVVLRSFAFEAPLTWLHGHKPSVADTRVLALCALATRHGGLARNRGRGHMRMSIDGVLARTKQYAESKQ